MARGASRERAAAAEGDPRSARRRAAASAFDAFKPIAGNAFASVTEAVVGNYASKVVNVVRDFLDDESSDPQKLLRDGMALSIGHWSDVLGDIAEFVANSFGKDPSEDVPNQIAVNGPVQFKIDEASQAADPASVPVKAAVRKSIKNEEAVPLPLISKKHRIPARNIRLSVADGQAYVSLVDLDNLHLSPGTSTMSLSVHIKGQRLRLATVRLRVDRGPSS